ncbi:glycosyltransferase family 39 protein, partial [bacterium]|nr:glycosyltransferase family 39 protein [bacterium]
MQLIRTWWIPLLVGSLTLLALLLTEPDYGYAIDEASYLWVAREERDWCSKLWERPLAESFSQAGLASGWHFLEPPTGDVSTHSNFNLPLSMHLINVGWLIGHSFLDELTASRLAPILLFTLTVTVVCHRLNQCMSKTTGLFAAVALALMPRIFGHAHLAATETILSFFWGLTILALLRMREKPRDSLVQPHESRRMDRSRWNAIT